MFGRNPFLYDDFQMENPLTGVPDEPGWFRYNGDVSGYMQMLQGLAGANGALGAVPWGVQGVGNPYTSLTPYGPPPGPRMSFNPYAMLDPSQVEYRTPGSFSMFDFLYNR